MFSLIGGEKLAVSPSGEKLAPFPRCSSPKSNLPPKASPQWIGVVAKCSSEFAGRVSFIERLLRELGSPRWELGDLRKFGSFACELAYIGVRRVIMFEYVSVCVEIAAVVDATSDHPQCQALLRA